MALDPTETVASYEMEGEALGLAEFITEEASTHIRDAAGRPEARPVIYVEDEHGRMAVHAKLVRVTLTDGSHVYNLVLSFDRD